MTKEDVKDILSIKGAVRGKMSHHAEAIEKIAGKEALKKIERKLKDWGHPMPKEELQKFRFYRIGEMILYLMAIRETLGWGKSDFEKMGRVVGKNLVIIKYLSPFFRLNQDFFFEKLPQFSNRFFKDLKMVPLKVDPKKSIGVFKIMGLKNKIHSQVVEEAEEIARYYFSGLFASWAQAVLGAKKVRCALAKSEKGGYVFKITWQ